MRSFHRHFCPIVCIALISGLLTTGGCNNNPQDSAQIKGLSGEDAEKLNAGRSWNAPADPPFKPETWYAAGQLAEAQGAAAVAANQYREALKLDPNYEPALYRLGVLLTQARQYPQAIETWKRYVGATKGSAIGYSNLGFCYELAGQTAEAETAYRQGIAKDPKCKPCRVNYGLLLARMGKTDQGLEQLKTVLSPAEAHYDLGSVFEQMGKKELAREQYLKSIQLDPNMQDARSRLSQL